MDGLGSSCSIDVTIRADKTITVADNGVGMNREEVVANLGTIAKSGTREFFAQLTGDRQKDAHLIGQFGVGFYSGFIVAKKITVVTRRAGSAEAPAAYNYSVRDPDGSLRAGVRLDPGTVYTVVSQRPLITPAALRASRIEPVPPEISTLQRTRPMIFRISPPSGEIAPNLMS